MKCYLFGNVAVTDPERFADYLEKVPAIIARHGGRYIVRGGAVYPLEGELGVRRMVMLEFESRAAAQAFYDGEDYAPLKKLRMETSESQIMFVDALGGDYVVGPDGDINGAVHKSRLPPAE
ncbi:D-fructose-6-phosphate amidotransferase [Sphingopyxis bauzanensis]|uniref:D-fructose-6-phosphate amidotransferase n=1 Tax=Sphingopyxis bauzanensis TaxID=651663 RepID=A0A246JR49_9SPHN|nr:DUF1330 domain-containing protein [Sphingopyxis bauzanensis]OWQ95448.1 D-fructose-6-phosphate amidotransferase [Sphingopyxis bauzanensis]GGJ53066.1 hypothetical protein GCM10011393_24120 [Sphingopyxis bauzanensis]